MFRTKTARVFGPTLAACLASAAWAGGARATEGGASLYLLGTGGPEAAELPPIEGVFFANTLYYYDGQEGGSRPFPIGGNVVAGLDATIWADFASGLWVPSTDVAGGTLAVGAILPFGEPDVKVDAVITGPLGNSANVSVRDKKFVVGDPVLLGELGWKKGRAAWAVSTLVNVPVGDYRAGHLANLAFHRWAVDVSLAGSFHDAMAGWDLSAKTGFTFNGENPSTDYKSGTEWHLEASLEKAFSPAWSAGLQAYYFSQVTGDSGAGATLGDFKGQVTGVGGQVAHNFKIAGRIPATLRLHALTEFAAKNRLEGTSVFLDFSMPLWVKLPPGAAAP